MRLRLCVGLVAALALLPTLGGCRSDPAPPPSRSYQPWFGPICAQALLPAFDDFADALRLQRRKGWPEAVPTLAGQARVRVGSVAVAPSEELAATEARHVEADARRALGEALGLSGSVELEAWDHPERRGPPAVVDMEVATTEVGQVSTHLVTVTLRGRDGRAVVEIQRNVHTISPN